MTDIRDQHFLTDVTVIDKMIALAEIHKTETVLDIGAGSGNITLRIPPCKKIFAVESDKKFVAELEKIPNVTVLEGSAAKMPLAADKIISNLPFSAAESILLRILTTPFKKAVFLLPLSLLRKLQEGTALAVLFNAFFTITDEGDVDPASFTPVPHTKPCIMTLAPKKANATELVIQKLWLQRDKKLKNALRETRVQLHKATKREAETWVDSLKLSPALLLKEIPKLTFADYQMILSTIK